jgi:hypothetical protein
VRASAASYVVVAVKCGCGCDMDGRRSEDAAPWLRRESMLLIVGGSFAGVGTVRLKHALRRGR